MKQNQQFTIGLVVAAVALGGYMYFVEAKKENTADTKDVEIWSLSDVQAKDLNALTITADGKNAVYNRSGDDWKLASEPTRTVDKAGFDTSFNYLKNLTANRKVEDKPTDPAKYGLKTPATVVKWGDDNSKYKLEIGDKSPTGDSYYVHDFKDDGVYSVAAYKVDAWKGLATKPPLTALPTPAPSPVATAAPASGTAPAPAGSTAPTGTAAPAATAAPVTTATPAATPSK